MRSSTNSFAHSYQLFKKYFVENYENLNISYLPYFPPDLHQIFTVILFIGVGGGGQGALCPPPQKKKNLKPEIWAKCGKN